MIGSRSHPAGQVGITAMTLEDQNQQTELVKQKEKLTRGNEDPAQDIFNNNRRNPDRKAQASVYVPLARRRQEVRFMDKPDAVIPPRQELTDEEMEHILDQPAVLPCNMGPNTGYKPDIIPLG